MNHEYDQRSIAAQSTSCRAPTVRERLEQQRLEMTQQLEKVNAAIAALDRNPDILEVLELLGRAGY